MKHSMKSLNKSRISKKQSPEALKLPAIHSISENQRHQKSCKNQSLKLKKSELYLKRQQRQG